jgi:phage shock protein PspC (stress-responsive transcriptional regulator)
MRRVITVSLNGNAFQLEDDAYAALAAYLEAADRALVANPDRAEIVADLEQAIADKSARFLGAHRTVLIATELAQILTEMGPVDGEAATESASANPTGADARSQAPGEPPPRRLYQITEGAKVSGVCMGLAAYFGIDVTIVRLAFVIAVFMTGGAAFLAYIVLMFVVPYAQTSEQHAAAHGLPFNARALVERAKRQAAEFTNQSDWQGSRRAWKREWRASRAAWKREWRASRADWKGSSHGPGDEPRAAPPPPPAPPPGPAPRPFVARLLTGFVLAVLGVCLAAFSIAWVFAIITLATTGALLGWSLPDGTPFWVGIVVLCLVYSIVVWPLKALRRATAHPAADPHGAWVATWDGLVAIAGLVALAWYGYHHVPQLHDFVDHVVHGTVGWYSQHRAPALHDFIERLAHVGTRHRWQV